MDQVEDDTGFVSTLARLVKDQGYVLIGVPGRQDPGTLKMRQWAICGATLSDEEVLALADSKMEAAQNERLGELQAKGKTPGLTDEERAELLTLLHTYQTGQLRKSEGLAEAVRRGLRAPLNNG